MLFQSLTLRKETQYFHELIAMLRWGTEMGRVDMLHELSILSQYQASPRECRLDQLIHIWAFLKKNPKLTLYFDQARPLLDDGIFKTKQKGFKDQHSDAQD